MKNYFLTILKMSFLFSFVFVVLSMSFDNGIIDHPLSSMKLSLSDKFFLASYTFSFSFLLLLPFLTILLPVILCVIKSLKTNKVFHECLFLVGMLAVVHYVSFFCLRLFHSGFIASLLLISFYFLLPVLIFSKNRKSDKNNKVIKLIILNSIIFIAICVSANNAEFVPVLTKEFIDAAVLTFIILVLLAAPHYNSIEKLVFQVSKKIIPATPKKMPGFVLPLMITLLILAMGISIVGFLFENRENNINYKDITSSTKLEGNVILIVIDALRADHLGCYGYERQTSPHLDAFAKEGVLFENCYVQASWTKPSTASLLTSLYPTVHQAIYHGSALPPNVVTLAEMLKEQGYLTYSYVANPNLKTIFNFDQGFDFYDDYLMRDKLYYAAMRNFRKNFPFFKKITEKTFCFSDRDNIKLANKRIIPWLKKYSKNNFFMYLHYMDPHDPYSPPPPYDKMYPYIKGDRDSEKLSLYDGEIRFVDEYIGRLFEKLKTLGVYDKSLIVITSDHGEAFGEHNDERHGHTVYNELLEVPLIIKLPDSTEANVRIEKQVRSIDILPFILDFLKISYKEPLDGNSLLPLLNSNENEDFCEYVYVDNNYDEIYVLKGLVENNEWKYIYTERSPLRDVKELGHEELYNLIDDPEELNNLIKQHPGILKTMRKKLDFYKQDCEKKAIAPSQVELDSETIRNLKSLGYLQ